MTMSADEKVTLLWETIKQRIKAAELNQPLYRALDAAVAIALDGNHLVVGFDVAAEPEMHHLNAPGNQPLIRKVLGSVATRPIELVTIDGTTAEDYQHYLARQKAAEELRQRARAAADPAVKADDAPGELLLDTVAAPHDDYRPAWIGECANSTVLLQTFNREVQAMFRRDDQHTLALVKARFLPIAFRELAALERAMPEFETELMHQTRHVSRAIDHLATTLDADAVTLAIAYEHWKWSHV